LADSAVICCLTQRLTLFLVFVRYRFCLLCVRFLVPDKPCRGEPVARPKPQPRKTCKPPRYHAAAHANSLRPATFIAPPLEVQCRRSVSTRPTRTPCGRGGRGVRGLPPADCSISHSPQSQRLLEPLLSLYIGEIIHILPAYSSTRKPRPYIRPFPSDLCYSRSKTVYAPNAIPSHRCPKEFLPCPTCGHIIR